MKRMIRSLLFGSTTALALLAGSAQAHDVEYARSPVAPASTEASLRFARWDRDGARVEMRHEYRELDAARERFYRGWRGDRHDRYRFERWCAARRAELDRRWAHEPGRW